AVHFFSYSTSTHPYLHSFPTRRSSDLQLRSGAAGDQDRSHARVARAVNAINNPSDIAESPPQAVRSVGEDAFDVSAHNQFVEERSEEHTSELQSLRHLVCRLLLEKKNQ